MIIILKFRGLSGKEIFYDCLRANLQSELQSHEDFYRASLPYVLDDEDWSRQFNMWCTAAAPTHGDTVGEAKWLEGIHILGLANVLKRPILLLDRWNCMQDNLMWGCGM